MKNKQRLRNVFNSLTLFLRCTAASNLIACCLKATKLGGLYIEKMLWRAETSADFLAHPSL